MSAHPGNLLLERYSSDDLPPHERERVAAHLASCAECSARVGESRSLGEARIAAVPPERFLDQVAERRDRNSGLAQRRRTWAVGGGVLASLAAAAALLLVLRPGPVIDGGGGTDDVRLKGAGFSLVRKRGAEQHEMSSTDRVRAGDALEVVVTQGRAGDVAAWIVDGSGRIDPVVEGAVAHLGAGRGALPASMVVDAPCTPMVVVAAAGEAIAPTETAMRAAVAKAGGLPASGDWVPGGGWWRRVDCE